MQPFDQQSIRKDFPMMKKIINGKPLVYLDTASTSQKPQVVIDTLSQFYEKEYGTVHRAVYQIAARSTEMYSAVRKKVQRFINAKQEEEIVFTRGATEGINLIAYAYGRAFLKKGDEIILSEMEHHSNLVPWQLLAQEKGIKIRYIPISFEAELNLDLFKKLLSEKTKLVSIAHVSNATGTVNPIEEIIELAHAFGAKVIIDGAQAASHMTLDMQALNADFYVFSGHKMYGPTGIGILYGKLPLLEAMPPFMGGGDMIELVEIEKSTFQKPPFKFEAGTPSIAPIMGLGAAIDYIQEIGRKKIDQWEKKLTTYALETFQAIEKIKIIGAPKKRGPIISFLLEGIHPLDLGTFLDLKGIAIRTGHLCAYPTMKRLGVDSLARLSFGIYNTIEEIDQIAFSIREAISVLNPIHSF